MKMFPLTGLIIVDPPSLFNQGERDHWNWRPGKRGYFNLWICLNGHARVTIDGKDHSVRPWSALLLPPASSVKGWSPNRAGLSNFAAHWKPRDNSRFPLLAHVLREIDTANALVQGILRLSAYDHRFSQKESEYLLLALLALIWREFQMPLESPYDRVIFRQIERLRSGDGLFLSMDALAREASLSRGHYNRRFKRITGLNTNAFMIRQRVERAMVLLRETDWTVEKIADSIGYPDLYYFSRQFSLKTGLSPTAFRRGWDGM